MFALRKTTIRAALAVIGTIIGAGVFGVPAMMDRAGILLGSVIFWIIALLILATHLYFVDVIATVEGRHRLPGYIGAILGPWAGRVGVAMNTLQLVGANLAYMVLGGMFIKELIDGAGAGADLLTLQVLFWVGGAVTVFYALRIVAKIESFLTWLLIAVMSLLILSAVPHVDAARFFTADPWHILAPIGIFIFAMFGLTVIAEAHEITGRKIAETRRAVAVGTLTAAVFTWLFGIFIALGLPPGGSSDPAAFSRLLPSGWWWAVPLFGFLAVATSFITSAYNLQSIYRLDVGVSKLASWAVALGSPLLLLFLVTRDFLNIIEIVGALFSATNGLLVILAAHAVMRRVKNGRRFFLKEFVPYATAGLFLVAILQRLLSFAL
ncbi:hypothetical protein HY479_02250 [Candidatus Uhrbacteria bacterium]|nr:hypothetical protein [Candidatus Uhrbacteria bacterium]